MRHLGPTLLFLLITAGTLRSQTVANFVTVSPCRIADTRDPSYPSGFGPPYMPARTTRNFAVPASNCGIPSSAIAYSLNLTVVPLGPVLYLSVWPAGQPQPVVSTLNSPSGAILANAAIVPAGANGAISVYTHGDTNVLIDINGYYTQYVPPTIPPPVALPTILPQSTRSDSLAVGTNSSSAGDHVTALGVNALNSANPGSSDTAIGTNALFQSNGNSNTAVGAYALNENGGSTNTAVGAQALGTYNVGASNVAVGSQALFNNGNANNNVAVGTQALFSNNTGNSNVAIGFQALFNSISSLNDIAIGDSAGINVSLNNNIEIGNVGAPLDTGTIRLGTQGTHVNTYIAGILGHSLSSGQQIYVDGNGQLGVFTSSARYKEDIHAITNESDKLLQLRPVSFRYKQAGSDGSKPIQYGLIAEEVAQIYPELVVHNEQGQVEGVQYQLLPALLLKQIQKQQQIIDELQQRLQALESARQPGVR